ncbi:uncharacterized protein DS421_14g478390 [Arachis hypogaea]|nr:uncharacterized protein DS421_14g478390 [Arachis hypogaea]
MPAQPSFFLLFSETQPNPQTSTPTFRPSVRPYRRRPPSLTLPPPFFLFFLPYFSISFLLYATPLFVAPPLSAPSSSGENHQRRRNSVPLRHYLRSLRYLLFSLLNAGSIPSSVSVSFFSNYFFISVPFDSAFIDLVRLRIVDYLCFWTECVLAG